MNNRLLPVRPERFSPVVWGRHKISASLLSKIFATQKPAVLVISIPRSGSSWVGEILGASPSALYLREPITQGFLSSGGTPTVFTVNPESPPGVYERLATDAFGGVPAFGPGVLRYPDQWRLRKRSKSRIVIKEVNPMALEWIIENYAPKVVLLIRHPAAVAQSYFRLGWVGTSIDHHFPSGYRRELLADKSIPKDFWHYSGFFQGAVLRTAFDTLERYEHATVVRYEELCLSPIQQFKELIRFAGLEWSKNLEQKIVEKSVPEKQEGRDHSNPYGTNRASSEMVNSWKGTITNEQLGAVRDGFLSWGLNVYSEGEW